jgi:hypothetical protein
MSSESQKPAPDNTETRKATEAPSNLTDEMRAEYSQRLTHIEQRGNYFGGMDEVLEQYKALEREPSKDTLLDLGKMYLDRYDLDNALQAYSLAGEKPPHDKLIAIGDECFKEAGYPIHGNTILFGIRAYVAAEAKDKLIAIGDKFKDDQFRKEFAVKAYEAAGARDKLIKMGDDLMEDSLMNKLALGPYIAAGAKEKLIEMGDKLFNDYLRSDSVISAYVAAGRKDKLIAAAKYYESMGLADQAQEATKAAEGL